MTDKRVYVNADADDQKIVRNQPGGDALYYGDSQVTVVGNEGSLAAGASMTLTSGKHFISGGDSNIQVESLARNPVVQAAISEHDANASAHPALAKLGAANTFTAKQTGNAGADWLGGDVKLGRATNGTTPDFAWSYANEKLSVRGLMIGDVGDAMDFAIRRAGPDNVPEPHGDYAGPHLAIGSGVNLGSIYWEAWGATATLLNGAVTLPTATITVDSTTGFPSSGTIYVNDQAVTYTGKTATTFTGCSGGTGLQADNTIVSYTDGDWDGASAGQGKQAQIIARTTELQTRTARGTEIGFFTTPPGADQSIERVRITDAGRLKALGRIEAEDNITVRLANPAQVELGDVGPAGQAGARFGSAADSAIYRVSAETISTNADFTTITGKHFQWSTASNEQSTVGAAGGASALPATPSKYLKVKDSAGATLVIPAYAAS